MGTVLPRFTALVALDLSNNKIGVKGARALAAALKETKLATLDLSKNYMIGTDGTKALAAFCAVSSTLTELSLKENELGDEGVVAIRDALAANKACKLEKLNLWKNRIGADGANALTAFCAANATLRRIHLGANALGRKGKAALREVAEQKNREVVAARGERFELKLSRGIGSRRELWGDM